MKITPNIIPLIIHPLGKSWRQPDPKNFLIDDDHVVMTQEECNKLATYSTSKPSGVYAGKMWKRETNKGKLILCWYGYHQNPNFCSNNERWILIA